MKRTFNDSRINIVAEQGQGGNPDAIFKHGDRHRKQNKYQLPPPGIQKKMTRQKSGDEKRQTGTNSAALRRHFNTLVR